MKLLMWVLLGTAFAGLAFWFVVITAPGSLARILATCLVVVADAGGALGAFWMMYMAIRREKHPLPESTLRRVQE
jgi:hypothetical protein